MSVYIGNHAAVERMEAFDSLPADWRAFGYESEIHPMDLIAAYQFGCTLDYVRKIYAVELTSAAEFEINMSGRRKQPKTHQTAA